MLYLGGGVEKERRRGDWGQENEATKNRDGEKKGKIGETNRVARVWLS